MLFSFPVRRLTITNRAAISNDATNPDQIFEGSLNVMLPINFHRKILGIQKHCSVVRVLTNKNSISKLIFVYIHHYIYGHKQRYIYPTDTPIPITYTSSSSSSCRATSTDNPDPLSPLLLIVHRFLQVLWPTSHILTESLYVGSKRSPCPFLAMWEHHLWALPRFSSSVLNVWYV